MGTVLEFERQSNEGMIASTPASAPALPGSHGIDLERLEEVVSTCRHAVARVVLRSSVLELEKLELVLSDPGGREVIERLVRTVSVQIPSQLVTLAHSLLRLHDLAERASKLGSSPQRFVVERLDLVEG